MPVGENGGHQPNLLMFELVMLTRDPFGLVPDLVSTIAVHPLLVAPSNISYTDATRSTVQETFDGSLETKAGRALRNVQLSGVFGVEERGLGPYIGTGELRFQRFYHEIVRLSDAISKDQVNAEKDLFRSPFLSLLLIPYDPERSLFAVNFYDFWHNVKFSALVTTFRFEKRARGGGSTGLTWYTLQLKEVGPIVTGGIGTALINGLFEALTTWTEINDFIKSYTLDAIVGAFVNAGGIVADRFVDSMNAFKAQADGATAIANGFGSPDQPVKVSNQNAATADNATTDAERSRTEAAAASFGAGSQSGLSPFLGAAAQIASAGTDLLETLRATASSSTTRNAGGAVDWGALSGEGSIDAIDAVDQQDGLAAVIDAATFQQAAGALYGMSREEWSAYLSATGKSGRPPSISGTVRYTVTAWDTVESLTRKFGVDWDTILRQNGLLPDEALLAGTQLLIPRERPIGQPTKIEGLPVLGSHAGVDALGSDLYADFRVDDDGRLEILTGPELLQQGVDWLIAQSESELISLANESPPLVADQVVGFRLGSILATDRRIASVDRVAVETNDGGNGLDISLVLTAINGQELRTGEAAS